jgi:predicted ATP-grasp superfamily ATP-dependent carboligase
MLLNAVNSEGMINVEAKVALRAGSSKLSLDVYERHYQGIMRRASHA